MAAAGVKIRQVQPRGVASHAAGAADQFRDVARQMGGEDASYLGLRLRDLLAFTEQVERQAAAVQEAEDEGVKVVFLFALLPGGMEPPRG